MNLPGIEVTGAGREFRFAILSDAGRPLVSAGPHPTAKDAFEAGKRFRARFLELAAPIDAAR